MNDEPDGKLLSAQQAADELCVSAASVYRWIAEGVLPVDHDHAAATWIRAADIDKLRRSRIWLTPFSAPIWPTG